MVGSHCLRPAVPYPAAAVVVAMPPSLHARPSRATTVSRVSPTPQATSPTASWDDAGGATSWMPQ